MKYPLMGPFPINFLNIPTTTFFLLHKVAFIQILIIFCSNRRSIILPYFQGHPKTRIQLYTVYAAISLIKYTKAKKKNRSILK